MSPRHGPDPKRTPLRVEDIDKLERHFSRQMAPKINALIAHYHTDILMPELKWLAKPWSLRMLILGWRWLRRAWMVARHPKAVLAKIRARRAARVAARIAAE